MKKNAIGCSTISSYLALVVIVAALFLFAASSFAQSTTDGAIAGIVTDQSGALVPGASVATKNLGTGAGVGARSLVSA